MLLSAYNLTVALWPRKFLNLLPRSAWRCGSYGYVLACNSCLHLCDGFAIRLPLTLPIGNLKVPSISLYAPLLAFELKFKTCLTHHSPKPCGLVRTGSNACSSCSSVPAMMTLFRSCGKSLSIFLLTAPVARYVRLIPIHSLFSSSAAISVAPHPQNGSMTRSPSFDEAVMIRL